MTRVDPSMSLGAIVTRFPSMAEELERQGLDYCCHGGRTLAEAAAELGLDPQRVADQLSNRDDGAGPADWAGLGPAELVDDIEAVHHRYLWTALPRISALVDKIVTVHGERHPELHEVRRLFAELRGDLEPHLQREEQVVFPGVRSLTDGPGAPDDGRTDALLEQLGVEHEIVGGLLEQLRAVTAGYTAPADGCATYQACYRALAELEADTHLHVHKENNVLIPAIRAGLNSVASSSAIGGP